MQPIYIVNLISPFILGIYAKVSQLDKKTQNRFILIVYSVIAVLIVGTRTLDTGIDTMSYYRFYDMALNNNNKNQFLSYFEPLFSLIGIISARLGFSFMGFNIIIAALTMLFFSLAVEKSSSNVSLSIFLYTAFSLFQQMMNQVRQGLAMMIILYAVTFLKDDKIKNYLFWILIAGLIHTSSFLAVLLVFFYRIELSRSIIRIYAVIGITGMLFSRIIFAIIIRYSSYGHLLTETWREYSSFDRNTIVNTLIRIFLVVFVLFFFEEIYESNKYINVYYHMAMVCTVLQLIAVMNNAIARITTIFFVSYLILIPEVFEKSDRLRKNWQLTYPAVVGFFFIYYFVYTYMRGFTEYSSFWF